MMNMACVVLMKVWKTIIFLTFFNAFVRFADVLACFSIIMCNFVAKIVQAEGAEPALMAEV